MQLSQAASLAVRGALALAERYGEGPIPLDRICQKQDLPKQYLAKIFLSLSRADLITPVRGKHGGYQLSHHPESISVLDVIEAVEGPLAMNFCQHQPPKCQEEGCPLRQVWTEIQEFVRNKLSSVTLADCVLEMHTEAPG